MPKIGNIELLYEGEIRIRHEIHYKQKQGFYIKGISSEFQGITNFRTWGYDTEKLLTETVQDACRLYRKLKTQSRLVILYKCEASSELRMNKVGEGSYQGILTGVSNKIQGTGYGSSLAVFGVDFEMAQVIDDGTSKKYYRVNPTTKQVSAHEINSVDGCQEMEYTEERYQFFLNLVEGMKKMVVSASRFFGVEPEKAILFIESNLKLLPSSSLTENVATDTE